MYFHIYFFILNLNFSKFTKNGFLFIAKINTTGGHVKKTIYNEFTMLIIMNLLYSYNKLWI